jgi:hypothetical protein
MHLAVLLKDGGKAALKLVRTCFPGPQAWFTATAGAVFAALKYIRILQRGVCLYSVLIRKWVYWLTLFLSQKGSFLYSFFTLQGFYL